MAGLRLGSQDLPQRHSAANAATNFFLTQRREGAKAQSDFWSLIFS